MASKQSKELNIRELFDGIIRKGLTPNQFYLLCCIKEGVCSSEINVHQDLRVLVSTGFVRKEKEKYILSPEAERFVEDIDLSFHTNKSKTLKTVLGDNFVEMIEGYINLWPDITIPTSKKRARVTRKNLEPAFKWFFDNYDYQWDTIYKATQLYEYEYRKVDYEYMRTSQYFVRKHEGGAWQSDLANYCDRVVKGDVGKEDEHFSEKVV